MTKPTPSIPEPTGVRPAPAYPKPVVPAESVGIYQFCPYITARPPLRCIGALNHERLAGHASGHDLQPISSVSVRAITRMEEPLERLGYPRPTWPLATPAQAPEAAPVAPVAATEAAEATATAPKTDG